MKEVLQGAAGTVAAACWMLAAALFFGPPAHAQTLALGTNGLGGGRYVGSARTGGPFLRAVGTLGYAHTEDVLSRGDRHERVSGELSGAYTEWSRLQLALTFGARYDAHESPATGTDSGLAGSTGITTRHAFDLDPNLAVALQTHLQFPAASSLKQGLAATTPEFAGLVSHTLQGGGEFTGMLGYRFDRSQHAVDDVKTLSEADRLATGTSRYDAALLGALLSAPLGKVTLIGEWSWSVNVGKHAPPPIESPLRLRGALQTLLGEHFVPSLEVGVDVSKRPALQEAARIEPRVWVALGLGLVFEHEQTVPSEPAFPRPPKQAASAEPEPETGTVAVRITDTDQHPIGDAAVKLSAADGMQSASTTPDGVTRFTVPREAELSFSVDAAGYRPATRGFTLHGAGQELAIELTRALPEGEIKGNVRSLRGGPLRARVEVTTTGLVVETQNDGTFHIEVPPGDYHLRISADGHEPQERKAQVEHHGVTILVVDLRRVQK